MNLVKTCKSPKINHHMSPFNCVMPCKQGTSRGDYERSRCKKDVQKIDKAFRPCTGTRVRDDLHPHNCIKPMNLCRDGFIRSPTKPRICRKIHDSPVQKSPRKDNSNIRRNPRRIVNTSPQRRSYTKSIRSQTDTDNISSPSRITTSYRDSNSSGGSSRDKNNISSFQWFGNFQ